MKEYNVQQLELAPKDASDQLNGYAKEGWEVTPGSVFVRNNRINVILEREKKSPPKKAQPKKKPEGKVEVEIVTPEEE
jgi:hypothetical protein